MTERRRSILHVDLDPFFVAVERSLDPDLRARPVVVGGDGQGLGFVAAVSEEAHRSGVRIGMPLARARQLSPDAAFRRGDLEVYGRVSDEVTAVLLSASRRLERPSADEAFVDLTPETPGTAAPVPAAETIRDALQRRLGLDVSLGLASSRLGARIASGWARPRGLLVVLPGYEASFLAPKPVSSLGLPPPVEAALERGGLTTLGQIAACEEPALRALVGAAAPHLIAAARGEDEPRIAVAAPPVSLQEETLVRDPRSDREALLRLTEQLARRSVRRLKPFRLLAGALTVEVRRAGGTARRAEPLRPPRADEDALAALACSIGGSLLEPASGVRAVLVRLTRLESRSAQVPLFPDGVALSRAR